MRRPRVPAEAGLLAVILLVGVLAAARTDVFLTGDNLRELLRDTSTYLVVACPLALLIVAGGIDFSVGAVFAAGGVGATALMTAGVPWPVALVLGIALGAAVGLTSGALVVFVKVPPFITTLAIFFVVSGTVSALAKGLISPLPQGFLDIGQKNLFGMPLLVWYAAVVGLVCWFVLSRTRFGYALQAVGGNRSAAFASGIPVRRVELTVYSLCGAAAALAGILYAARTSAGQPDAGGYFLTLEVLTMVLVGGVSLSGGVGTIAGVALGALLIGQLQNALGVVEFDPSLSDVFIGTILLLAVALDGARRRRRYAEAVPPTMRSGNVTGLELRRLIHHQGQEQADRILAAVDSERRRIERDLHDGTQQELVSAVMILQQASEQLRSSDDAAVTALLDLGMERLRSATQELRNLSRGIYPATLGEEGLVAAVESLVLRNTLRIELHADEVPRLPEAVETTAYFVVAEALTNILKHAHADRVTIDIRFDADRGLEVEVGDDGTGTIDEYGGTGLRGLRGRVGLVQGTLTVVGSPGTGTTVRANFPAAVPA